MIDITIKDIETGSWLATLETPVIPKVGEFVRLSGIDKHRPVVDVVYIYGGGEDSRQLSYVNVIVGPGVGK